MGIEDRIQTKTIDGYTYEVTPCQAAVGQKALLRFLRLAAPVLTAAASTGLSMSEAAVGVISTLATTVTDDDLAYFTKLFGPLTRFCTEGDEARDCWIRLTPDQQEMHFAARYMALFDWLRFAGEVNFGGFFEEAKRRAEKVKPATATEKR
jgi:hypothetical protein